MAALNCGHGVGLRRRTSRLLRLARNHDDCANKKSPSITAVRVPYLALTVATPVHGMT